MKIKIEDYYGNDICSFTVTQNNNGLADVSNFVDCSFADMEVDEHSRPYIRIQLEKENSTN